MVVGYQLGALGAIARLTGAQLLSGAGLWILHATCSPGNDAGWAGAVICSAGGPHPDAALASRVAAAFAMNIAMVAVMAVAGLSVDGGRWRRPCLSSGAALVLRWIAWALACAAFAIWPAGQGADRVRAVTIALLLIMPMLAAAIRVTPTDGRGPDGAHDPASDRPRDRSPRPERRDILRLRHAGPCMTVMALAGMSLPLMAGVSLAMAIRAVLPRSLASQASETLAVTAGLGLALI